MIGVLTNTIAVIVGSLIGLLCKRGIPKRLSDAVMLGIGLCTVYIGFDGALAGENTIVAILSMVLGAIAGTLLDLDGKLDRLGRTLEKKFQRTGSEKVSVAEGFVTASLLFCIGAMTIVGSLNAGLTGDCEMLFTKSVLDFISSIMLSVSLGIGVLCAGAFVLVFQGAIVLLAQVLQPLLPAASIAEMTCVGSLLILGLGLNLLGITKLKIANYLPAIVFAPAITPLANWLLTLF